MNAHQRRIARRRYASPPRAYVRPSALLKDTPNFIHGRADAEALYGVGSEWADIAEYFADRHRGIGVFTLDPTQPTRPLFEDGVRNAIARSGFE